MENHEYFRLIFAVGSLPFWTGLKKFKRFLLGEVGSFWEGEAPLKPIYLNHYFFSSFSRTDKSRLTSLIQNLIGSNYLAHGQLAENKPYRVLKLTGRGVRQYYNQLVRKRKLESPTWHLHHVAQLEGAPNSPIISAGELLNFSGQLYLTQTPGFVEPESRVKDEKSLKLHQTKSKMEAGQVVRISNLQVVTTKGVELKLSSDSEITAISEADLRNELTHFPAPDTPPEQENPFILRGKMVELQQGTEQLEILFEKNKTKNLILRTEFERHEELEGEAGNFFCFGPLKPKIIEFTEAEIPVVEMQPAGTIEPASPFA